MSREYSVDLRVIGLNPYQVEEIREAAEHEWPFHDWYEREQELDVTATATLTSGESEKEFATRLAKAIWLANAADCYIEIHTAYIEVPPAETFCFGSEEYASIMMQSEKTTKQEEP